MLTKRIIACLDMDDGRVVKGVQFVNLRDAGDPAECAAAHARDGADEIVLLDITATSDNRRTMLDVVSRTARCLFIPFTVGGGIRELYDAEAVFEAGADKIAINSAAVKDSTLIGKIAARFGSQAVVVAIDAKRVNGGLGGFEVFVAGGRIPTGQDAILWAREAAACGAGEIMLTSMDRDGTKAGFDCELTQLVADAVSIPVIASGGAGSARDFIEVFQSGRADAALAASIFHFGLENIGQLKLELRAANVPVRWPC
ncbi:MAG: imidazole glycerol phosphate synthase subunit HisF [Terriglobales bacterium]|jgi:cyclase